MGVFSMFNNLGNANLKLILVGIAAILFVVLFCVVFVMLSKRNNKIKAEMRELDYLTQIYNRGYFYKKCQLYLSKTNSKYFIVAFDIAKFKKINEYYGSDEADNILKDISNMLIDFYTQDTIKVFGRIESDKFSWIMPNNKEKLVKIFDSISSISNKYEHSISFKMGVYEIENNTMPIEQAYTRANLASKSIKGNFDKNIQYFDAKMVSNLENEQFVLNNIDKAMDDGNIVVFFQPKFDLQANEVCGAEALVRWKDPKKGMISPGAFIPALENNGLITKLDKYMWDRTARHLAEWCRQGLNPYPVSINISKVDLLEPDLPEYIEAIVRKYQIPHDIFQLEITESAYVDGSVDVTSILKSFKSKGFTILMDDFGSGYSSLNTLREFPIDVIKIDLKFLTNFNNGAEGDKGRTIIESIVSMAKRLNLGIVVEGTETIEQVNFVKSIGCETAQGYYFSKPIPADDYIDLIKQNRKLSKDSMFNSRSSDECIWNKNTLTQDFFNNVNGALGVFAVRRDELSPVKLNEKYFELIEQSRKEYYASVRNIYESIYPSDLDMLMDTLSRVKAENKPKTIVYRRINSNGNIKWIKATFTYMQNEDSITSLYFASLDDITEFKNMQRDVLEMADSFDSGIIKCDLKTNKVVFYNDKILDILGLTKDEFEYNFKNNYLRLISPAYQASFKNAVEEINNKESITTDISLISKDNKEIKVRNNARVIIEGNKKYSYFSITNIFDDIQ
jgi:diguanylate cyclase (GGDEF)-like protein